MHKDYLQEIQNIKTPYQQIRAMFNDKTIRVYQAYSDLIADSALANNTFISPPFKKSRMTWVKPSFLWMMYRAGWGFKDAGQKRILAIDITREGFEWALKHSCLSHPDHSISREEWSTIKDNHPVRVQWDPERDLLLNPLDYRSIQIGLSKNAVDLYINQWIQKITDVTSTAHLIHKLVNEKQWDKAKAFLPKEEPYPMANLDN